MSIKESIYKKSLKVKQRLFDQSVHLKGRTIQVVRITVEEKDIYNDSIDSVINSEVLEAIIVFPDKLPLERYRYGNSSETEETRTYFFEILPIECYTKFSDQIERKDILVFSLEDENNNRIPFVLQVTDSFGKFEYGITWKMQYLAPVNGVLPSDVRDYISDVFDNY